MIGIDNNTSMTCMIGVDLDTSCIIGTFIFRWTRITRSETKGVLASIRKLVERLNQGYFSCVHTVVLND